MRLLLMLPVDFHPGKATNAIANVHEKYDFSI